MRSWSCRSTTTLQRNLRVLGLYQKKNVGTIQIKQDFEILGIKTAPGTWKIFPVQFQTQETSKSVLWSEEQIEKWQLLEQNKQLNRTWREYKHHSLEPERRTLGDILTAQASCGLLHQLYPWVMYSRQISKVRLNIYLVAFTINRGLVQVCRSAEHFRRFEPHWICLTWDLVDIVFSKEDREYFHMAVASIEEDKLAILSKPS